MLECFGTLTKYACSDLWQLSLLQLNIFATAAHAHVGSKDDRAHFFMNPWRMTKLSTY